MRLRKRFIPAKAGIQPYLPLHAISAVGHSALGFTKTSLSPCSAFLYISAMRAKSYPHCSGFSLVELSIVLVILGLLTGGILAGRSLIRASELRSISVDFTNYETAILAFRDKYLGLPGDLHNATRFWGVSTANCDCSNDVNGTCNGNGNGFIDNDYGNPYERQRIWRHLSLAGLIEGGYPGGTGPSCSYSPPGRYVPAGPIGDSIYRIEQASQSTYYTYGKTAQFNRIRLNLLTNSTYLLKAEEAWNIDTKMDDGSASQGRVLGYPRPETVPGCATSNTPPADYDLDATNYACNLVYWLR